MHGVEEMEGRSGVLCYIVDAEVDPDETTFLTAGDESLQAGHIVYQGGEEISRHHHPRQERTIEKTSEAFFVQRGRCEVDIYDEELEHVATRQLDQGDIMVLLRGGHGFRMLQDTVLFEVKQGPYLGGDDKRVF